MRGSDVGVSPPWHRFSHVQLSTAASSVFQRCWYSRLSFVVEVGFRHRAIMQRCARSRVLRSCSPLKVVALLQPAGECLRMLEAMIGVSG